MDAFLANAQQLFDVARAAADQDAPDAGNEDFALLIRRDGGLHFIMEAPFSLDAAAVYGGAESAYRVTRSRGAVSVEGRSRGRNCMLAEQTAWRSLLNDQPLYRIASRLPTG